MLDFFSTWLVTTPTLFFELLIVHFTLYHKKRVDMLAYTHVEYNFLETLQRSLSSMPDKTSFYKKTILRMVQFLKRPLQWIQTLESLDRTLKIHSVISSLTTDKLEYDEEVNQLCTLMPLLLTVIRYDNESNELSKYYPLIFNWLFQRSLCTCSWFEFNVRYRLNFHYQDLVGESLRLEIHSTFPMEHLTELIVLGNKCLWLQLISLVLL